MRVLIVGAYGFIGQHITNGLLQAGYEVLGCGRNLELGQRLLPHIKWLKCDFNSDVTVDAWLPRLKDVDAVVNCVGILQNNLTDTHSRVHVAAPIALFQAAASKGVRRVIQISALGAEPDTGTEYSDSKSVADTALKGMDLDWVILKPSLVYASGVYGGTTIIRALAGLPRFVPLVDRGIHRFQPVAMSDLVATVAYLLQPHAPANCELVVSGPEEKNLREIVGLIRSWLAFPEPIYLSLPKGLVRPFLGLGDIAAWFGLPTAFRSTSIRQMELGNVGDPAELTKITGITPKRMEDALAIQPATLQDRLHARTAFALSSLRIIIGLFWIATGLVTLLPDPRSEAISHLVRAGLPTIFAGPMVLLGATADFLLGLPFLVGWQTRRVGALQLALMTFYVVFLSLFIPYMWLDPFGAVLKIFPIFAATIVVMASAEPR